ncbi:rhomboid family intramembrane serine protease [Sedimentitalea sp. HM32M-2]|uniref:rhomboid family intramembrane serine protease n=1 Tax=Sedimentitalea sp. HM32M-2 TaxID=3351566 RepID=UPI003637396A
MNRQDKTAIRAERQPAGTWWPALVVLIVLIVTCSVELTLQAADQGWIGTPRWRGLAYQNGAFWTGLLDNWKPNYSAQPWLMFLTYQGLHASLAHLLGNMLVLVLVGRILVPRVGQLWFAAIYLVSGIGGGLGFALLADSAQPMVGASGALFGLVGAWKWQDWFFTSQQGFSRKSLVLDVIGLIVLNVLLWVVQDGQLAWEAHLGGFLTGWLAATLIIPRKDSGNG